MGLRYTGETMLGAMRALRSYPLPSPGREGLLQASAALGQPSLPGTLRCFLESAWELGGREKELFLRVLIIREHSDSFSLIPRFPGSFSKNKIS